MLSLQKVAELLEEAESVGEKAGEYGEGRKTPQPSRSAPKRCLWAWPGVAGETWALSVDWRWLVLQLLVYFQQVC